MTTANACDSVTSDANDSIYPGVQAERIVDNVANSMFLLSIGRNDHSQIPLYSDSHATKDR